MRVSLLILGFVLPVTMSAQQWQPVTSSEKFNYRVDTAVLISNVIFADSAKLENGDSVFYLNRVVSKCIGCPVPGTYLCNQPQFLLKEMILHPGGVYLFKNPGSFILKTLAVVYETWLFDTAAAITAQVTAKSVVQVFGQLDSVKTISLSNGQVIKLSKDHGIIQFPVIGQGKNYLLEGISGRSSGTLLPGFREVYNFKVGDVFQFRNEWMSFAIGYGSTSLVKQRILTRDSTSQGYSYGVEQCRMSWDVSINGIPGSTSHMYQVINVEYTDSSSHICNDYPGQMVRSLYGSLPPPYDYVSFMNIVLDTGLTISRIVGPPEHFVFYYYGSDTLIPQMLPDSYTSEYTTGLGQVMYYDAEFEWYSYNRLIGYIKDGDTTGIIYPNDFILEKTQTPNPSPGIIVFPNPASERVFIRLPENGLKSVRVELFGSDGRIVKSVNEVAPSKVVSFDIFGVLPGLYILLIQLPGESIHHKIIIE